LRGKLVSFACLGLITLLALPFVLERARAADDYIASGPRAAAGSLYLIAKQGFPNLCPDKKNDAKSITDIAKILSSPRAMLGALDSGTSTAFPLFGIERYIISRGYVCGSLKFQGYRPCQEGYSAGTSPRMNWILAGTRQKTGECVLVGWYDHDSKENLYRRRGGQWLTVMGYQLTQTTKGCPTVLIVADPASGQRSWLYFEEIKNGKLVEYDSHGRLTRTTYPQGPVYRVKSSIGGQGTAILEGAAIFQVK